MVRLFFNELVDGKIEFEAKILDADLESVTIEAEGRVFAVPFSKINRAKYII
jgi:ribosome maturation factor RimP